MSTFISSLLNELGFRTRLAPDPQPHDQPEFPRHEPLHTSASDTDDPATLEQNQSSGGAGAASGHVGSLPSPPFFATLPKDMNGRTSEPEGTRPVPRSGSLANQPIVVTENNHSDTVQVDERRVQSEGGHDSRSQHADSIRLPGNPPAINTITRPGTDDGHGQSLNNNFGLDELGRVSLPEDDGMGWLRNKIHAIRDLNLSNNEKARMVHDLMTERYNSTRILSPNPSAAFSPTLSPSRPEQPRSPPTPGRQQPSELGPVSPTLMTSVPQDESSFLLTEEDLQPMYVPRTEPESPVVEAGEAGDEDPDTEELDEASLGCRHYMRNVKLQCYHCKKWYTCRFCHDEVEDHHLIRKDTENMLCMLCGHPQPAAHNCRQCGEQTAQYYCHICKLWDNDSKKSIYHCSDCGICRIGQGLGKDFFHCKTCCVCLPISIEDTHRCIERSTQCDCPICGDYMFTSPETVVVMRCGHSIHSKCLSEYSKTSFRCPICSKTITNMESTFRNLDRTIESQPMPSDFKDTKGLVYCNDCGAKSVVKYHWLGLKCDLCESYNTAQIRLLQGDVSAVLEEEGVSEPTPRPRSSSLNPRDEPTSLLPNTNQTPQSRLSVPAPDGPGGRFVSYNMTHGRAISPVVSNYFGLPPERESDKPSSLPFFGGLTSGDNENDFGALNFLSKKLRDRYGFLARDTPGTDGGSDAEEEEDAAEFSNSSDGAEDGEEEEDDDDDDDDGTEHIDIFGHR